MSAAAAEQTRIGSTVAGKYRLSRVLGRGGMGVVYEAEHLVTNRRVAIKVMHPESQVDSGNARRFLNEASAAGRIQHPNVVEVLDAGQDNTDGSLFIVLELLAGIDLATFLMKRPRLEPGETVAVVMQVLQALIEAHRSGIVHRDIKPENIFLARVASGETVVKIVDFGISKAMHPEKNISLSITQSNTTVGTPHYMSPEQAKGEPIDPRADIWALGVVIYECLTGRLPFDGENFNLQIVAVVTEAHQSATKYGVETDLSELIDRCLQKDRERRFASATEMLEALRRYVEKHPEVSDRLSLPGDHGPQLVAAHARPNDPTASFDLTAKAPGLAPSDTEEQLPIFPGMVPIDDELHSDNAPTIVRAIVPFGAAPLPISQRPGARSSYPPPPLVIPRPARMPSFGPPPMPMTSRSVPPRKRYIFVGALALTALASLSGFALYVAWSSRVSQANVQSPDMATLHFVAMRPGARVVVGTTPFYSDTAIVARGATPVVVRIEANGFIPLAFSIVPDRDQNVALPAMQPVPPPVPIPRAMVPQQLIAPPRPTPPSAPSRPSSPSTASAAVGFLSVGASPRCRVSIDGQFVGQTPMFSRGLTPGLHRLTCERDDSGPMQRVIQITSGREERVVF